MADGQDKPKPSSDKIGTSSELRRYGDTRKGVPGSKQSPPPRPPKSQPKKRG